MSATERDDHETLPLSTKELHSTENFVAQSERMDTRSEGCKVDCEGNHANPDRESEIRFNAPVARSECGDS